jgi:predicted dehydrogenase
MSQLPMKNVRRPIRTAVVGLGWVAMNRHIPQLLRNPDFDLIGVVDRRAERATEVARTLGKVLSAETGSLDDVDWLDEADAVVIATAPFSHYALATQALARGKHVLMEKPFAMSAAEGRAIVDAASASGRSLGIVHNFQFSRAMRALLADLESGALGEVRSVNGVQFGNPARRLPTWHEDLPLGLFYDESPHLLYLVNRIASAPLEVRRVEVIPSTRGLATPAQVNVTLFELGGSQPFSVRCNFEAPVSEWYLMVCGERALAIADVFRDIYLHLPNDGKHTAWPVLRTSLATTWQHWRQVVTQGLRHASGRLYYGNEEVYQRFGDTVLRDASRIGPISAAQAQRILELQQAIVAGASEPGS